MNHFESSANTSPGKLRLLVVTPLFPPAVGGASEDFRLLTEAWERSTSIEGIVVLTERREDRPAPQASKKLLLCRLLPVTTRDKKKSGLFYIASRVWLYAFMTIMIAWHLRTQGCKVVLIHARYGRPLFLKLLKLIRARVAVLLTDHFRDPEDLAACEAVICVTENVYESAASKLSGRCQIHYVPLPFENPEACRSIVPAEGRSPYFLFLGEVSRWKGADVLLEAFAEFRKDCPEYSLVMAGPVCDITTLASAGATFVGEVDHERALGLIRQAEALVLPSKSEGLPRVCLEAIALGTTVICPPGVPELQRTCPEWILPEISCRSVLEKLKQAVSVPFRSSFIFENYDPNRAAKRILDICNSLSSTA